MIARDKLPELGQFGSEGHLFSSVLWSAGARKSADGAVRIVGFMTNHVLS